MATTASSVDVTPLVGKYAIDPTHTEVGFVARHLMISKVRGRFGGVSGDINIADPVEESSVDVTIDASTIDTGTPDRDAHLRSPDFFDVEKYPTLKFRSTEVRATSDSTLEVVGDLTILDVTKPVTLQATYEGFGPSPFGDERIGLSAVTEIDREDWGLTWNAAIESGGVVVGKKVKLEIEVEAIRS